MKLPLEGSNPTWTLWVKLVGLDTVPVRGHLAKIASNQPYKSFKVFKEIYRDFLPPEERISSKQYGLS